MEGTLLDAARIFLRAGREELEAGLSRGDQVKVRDAAEKAWNAVVQATDFVMQRNGRSPLPGPAAHRDRRDFLEGIGRRDLAQKYTYFAEVLHGDVFYSGATLPMPRLRQYLDEVEDYIQQVSMV